MLLSLLRRFSQTRVGRTLLVAAVGSLLAAQQASLLHSLGHLAASGQALAAHAPATGLGADPSKPADADVHCDKCFQLSQVAGYLFGGPAAAVLAPAGQEVPRLLAIAGRSVDPLGPRSRGPPAVL